MTACTARSEKDVCGPAERNFPKQSLSGSGPDSPEAKNRPPKPSVFNCDQPPQTQKPATPPFSHGPFFGAPGVPETLLLSASDRSARPASGLRFGASTRRDGADPWDRWTGRRERHGASDQKPPVCLRPSSRERYQERSLGNRSHPRKACSPM